MAYAEIRKRVPIDLTMSEWRALIAEHPGIPLAQVLRQIHIRGLIAIREEALAKESV